MNALGKLLDAASSRFQGIGAYLALSLIVLFVAACPAIASGDWSSVLAWALTFIPGILIVWLAARFRHPDQAMPFMLLSMMFRFAVAAGGGLLALWLIPSIPRTVFLLWLGCLYLVALAAELYVTMSIKSLSTLIGSLPQAAAPGTHLPEARR